MAMAVIFGYTRARVTKMRPLMMELSIYLI